MGIKSMAARFSLMRASSRTDSAPVILPLNLQDKSLLVLLPATQSDLTLIKQVLPDVTRLFGQESVHLLAAPDTNVRTIFPSKGFRIISPSRSAVNWCKLPTSSFLCKLDEHKFDYIFDTNLENNTFAARVLLNFPNAVRFGCNGRLGTPYLNLEIKTKFLRDRRLIYRSMLEVISNISKTTAPQTS